MMGEKLLCFVRLFSCALWCLGFNGPVSGKDALKEIHRKMTKSELSHTFGVSSHLDVPDYDIFWPKIHYNTAAVQTGQDLIFSFDAWNDTFKLALTPKRDLVSDDVISIIRDRTGGHRLDVGKLPRSSDCHYTGRALSHRNASAALSHCGHVRGSIIMDDHFLVLHPLPTRFHRTTSRRQTSNRHRRHHDSSHNKPHVVFKRAASLLGETISLDERAPSIEQTVVKLQTQELDTHFCDVTVKAEDLNYTLPSKESGSSAKESERLLFMANSDPITVELALFMDAELWRHFVKQFGDAQAEQEMVHFCLALINNVHMLYQQPTMTPNLNVVIVRFEIWKTQPAGLATFLHKNGHAQRLLDRFCQHQRQNNVGTDRDAGHWDHATLLTGYDIYHRTTSVAGVAPVGRMCDHEYTCSLVEGLHLGRSFVLAHEMGHNLGMVHDGVQNHCSRSCCLMSAINGAGKTTWSKCSVREINAYLSAMNSGSATASNCLLDAAVGLTSHDHSRDGRLPGQRFTADQQCAFFWGSDYREDARSAGKQLKDICHILWCGNTGATISTAHPALEGTWCGGQNWCQYGRCVPWLGSPNAPSVVAGGWSAWLSPAVGSCSSCKITGSISVRVERRRCDNPPPNNGGTDCVGSSLRGVGCGRGDLFRIPCTGHSTQAYADQVCQSFLNDPDRPDRQLTGKSFQHNAFPCKVWCHLTWSDQIRHKAGYPDGTPCGNEMFCVEGECLKLGCGASALVGDESECPSSEGRRVRQTSRWSEWGSWAPCSVTCGPGGSRTRRRSCSSTPNGVPSASCPGVSEATESCGSLLVHCSKWTRWGDWSPCTVTCGGGGTRSRSRSCSTGIGCDGSSISRETCSSAVDCVGSWSVWGSWAACSASCGGGTKQRRRTCSGGGPCFGGTKQSRDCFIEPCELEPLLWSEWSDWSECSVSCGVNGSRARQRVCHENQRDSRSECTDDAHRLELGPCAEIPPCTSTWLSWANWGDCSRSCGRGVRQRLRQCASNLLQCVGLTTEVENCDNGQCNTFSDWSPWTACSESCGLGIRTRSRVCPPSSLCIGALEHEEPCLLAECAAPTDTPDTGPPRWSVWGGWGRCSATCGTGFQSRRRQCVSSVGGAVLITDAGTQLLGGQSRCGVGSHTNTQACRVQDCPSQTQNPAVGRGVTTPQLAADWWTTWELWTECSRNCGGGKRERVRHCVTDNCANPEQGRQAQDCNVQPCNDGDSWSPWSDWSECPQTCGGGRQFRERACDSRSFVQCRGFTKEERPCNTRSCTATATLIRRGGVGVGHRLPEWSNWSGWSGCSCFNNKQMRRRYCLVYQPQLFGFCTGAITEERRCLPGDCSAVDGEWSGWSEWSECSEDCGDGGTRIRHRMCTEPFPVNRGAYCRGQSFQRHSCPDQAQCSGTPVNGAWSDWQPWEGCSASCGNGYRSRTRYCTQPEPQNGGQQCRGGDFELEACQGFDCSASLLTKSSGNAGNRTGAVNGGWAEWSSWSACSSSCGFGFRDRSRHCDQPKPNNGGDLCVGIAHMINLCSLPSCPERTNGQWSVWSGWSDCIGNCGFGLISRVRSCTSPAPSRGGFPCYNGSFESKFCAPPPADCHRAVSDNQRLERIAKRWETALDTAQVLLP